MKNILYYILLLSMLIVGSCKPESPKPIGKVDKTGLQRKTVKEQNFSPRHQKIKRKFKLNNSQVRNLVRIEGKFSKQRRELVKKGKFEGKANTKTRRKFWKDREAGIERIIGKGKFAAYQAVK